MTTVTSGTEIIKRHHMMAPIEHGTIGDLTDLVNMVHAAVGSNFDDAARLIPDDENVHLVWDEVVDADYRSDLDNYLSFAGIELEHDLLVRVLESVKKWRAK